MLDCTERSEIPPFGHMVDYLCYGGIYREVWLEITEETYIEDLYITTPNVMYQYKIVEAQITFNRPAQGAVGLKVSQGDTVLGEKSAEIDGRMVASGLAICDREYVGIYAIYVSPSTRKRHYARAICSTLLANAKEQGAKKAYLQVVQGNMAAKNLYLSLGFKDFYTYWFRSRRV